MLVVVLEEPTPFDLQYKGLGESHAMHPNYYRSNTHQPLQRSPLAAYLMGMTPMRPLAQQDRAVAMANRLLNGGRLREEEESSSEDENVNPQPRAQHQPRLQSQDPVAPALGMLTSESIKWGMLLSDYPSITMFPRHRLSFLHI